jgi:HD-GYP domain-containing protein (c-di-GMP phosphodiesterase class II)
LPTILDEINLIGEILIEILKENKTVHHEEDEIQNSILDYKDSTQREISRTVEEIFIRFSSAWKTAQIYEPNNLTFIKQIEPLFELIQNILNTQVKAVFYFRDNTLFFNTIRVKFDFFSYQNFRFLADEFRKKEIGTIGFKPGLDKEELVQFVYLLADLEAKKENIFEDLEARIKARELHHIILEKLQQPFGLSEETDPEQVRQNAKRVYAKSITHLREVFKKQEQEKRIGFKTTRRLIQTIIDHIMQDESFMIGLTNVQNYDEYTLNHSANVAILSICFGRRLGLEKKELVDLGISSFFHDIGKLEIPKEILEKEGKLDEDERALIEKHPYHGAGKLMLLKELSYLPIRALYVALEHHLWANLSGYPKSWKRDAVGLFSRIVKICDVFDALTTIRPYRKRAFTRDEAMSIILETSGTEFDPILLKVFANMMGIYPIGTLVALNTDELGIVVETNSDTAFMLRPKLKLITDEMGNKLYGEIVDLTEMDSDTNRYKRTIVKSLDPHKYNIQVADYFLAM